MSLPSSRIVSFTLALASSAGCTKPAPGPEPAPVPAPAPATGGEPAAPPPPAAPSATAAAPAFANAAVPPPPGYQGPLFQLSHDYPATKPPACSPEQCPWLGIDVDFTKSGPAAWKSAKWSEYIASILKYVREGQDPNLSNEVGFRAQVKGQTRWFHVPWMAYDLTVGREFVHGTTNERTASLEDFTGDTGEHGVSLLSTKLTKSCQEQWKNGFESWAVGMYNPWGGYALGQVIPKDGKPATVSDGGVTLPAGLPFPEGTMVAKLLFTNANVECVPYLKGAPVWQVDRHKTAPDGKYICERAVQPVLLTQMDVAVVDHRSPTGWVYGTYGFDGTQPGKDAWEHLVPLGVQWGSDPDSFAGVDRPKSGPIRESVLNPGVKIYEHWGCNKRLAGPVDNPLSSCVSCHASAYAAAPVGTPGVMGKNVPPSFGFEGLCKVYSEQNKAYFTNRRYPEPYGPEYAGALPLDTSLQLAVAFTQYGYFATDGAPQTCKLGP